ncbi:protein-methionine-sulfoxide reductase catalytic subunit MsrP [Pseudoduganella ginsengisoli]|uniref:Protein-methionine-sulfoxide reductase catalytic subunit MsrP n=1 Tax=Pseudoduganella ginsengisoli TaxID=1462440 RepID=A0A6L6Q2H4_9BURK|nr:protein-methionine-sulfoxide reductase catalytic subunit MsrP [Pseudoduganella ginsengisoli]MTW03696.1 protein-methionine-sulfoxide reductase catalytic subunit MsrP [Pseudoduganella ginsengisoli]
MLIKRSPNGIDLPFPSEITPRDVYESRRTFIRQLAVGTIAGGSLLEMANREAFAQGSSRAKLPGKANPAYIAHDKVTAYKDATTYNNFYEFGTDKSDPAENAHTLIPRPWTVSIEGEVKKPMTLDLDQLLKLAPLEERIYRLRCVEGWSMVIPWTGYSLSELIKKAEPTGNAKYVEFVSLADRKQMPGVGSRVLNWPYVEGLRMDEAMHPLALLTLGMYGELLPNQNGAPVRIVLPWKYGFKSAKSIVKIRFVKEQPRTAWNVAAPSEYGFYSNVNPEVDHPRWSQAAERRIGEDGFLAKKRKTLMFNGYSDVAPLYAGMDLKRFF